MIQLGDYSAVAVNISGGKDSQVTLGYVIALAREQSYNGQLLAIHADTGAEWPQSLPHCRLLCDHYQIPLHVALPFRALPAHIERRCRMMAMQQPRGKPGWPSPQQRYCTSDCKRGPIETAVREAFPAKPKPGWPSAQIRYCTAHCKVDPIHKVIRAENPANTSAKILVVTGERREESPHRAKLPALEPDKRLTAGQRSVMRWRPILDYKLADVWAHIAATGLPRHVAYDRGNERLSCAICMLATDNDIRNGAAECPELAEHYLRIEKETGFTMKNKKSLAQILGRSA